MGEHTAKAKAKAKEVVGYATGDRRVEAEGRAEQRHDDVEREERQVREERGELRRRR